MGPPTTPTKIAKSNPSIVNLQTNPLSPPQSPQPIPPSHFSADHTHHIIKYLEQLLDSSLATAAVIQFSGNTLADVLTPRAYDTFKALYALAALDVPTSSTKPRGSKIPTRSTFSDIGNDCPYSSHFSPPLRNSSLAVPHTGKIHVHISFSVDYVFFFSWVGLAAVSCLAVIYLGFVKGSSWSKRPFRKQGIYIGMLTTSCDKEFHDEFKIMFSYQMMHSPRAFVSFFFEVSQDHGLNWDSMMVPVGSDQALSAWCKQSRISMDVCSVRIKVALDDDILNTQNKTYNFKILVSNFFFL